MDTFKKETLKKNYKKIILNIKNISAGIADIGIMLPLLLTLALKGQVNLLNSLLLITFGYFLISIFFKTIISLQPLKSFAAIALTTNFSPKIIQVETIIFGLIMAGIANPKIIGKIDKITTFPIIRGIQFTIGFTLIKKGMEIAQINTKKSIILFLVLIIFIMAVNRFKYLPTGPIILISGFILELFTHKLHTYPLIPLSKFNENYFQGFILLVIPQIALTIGNAAIATENTVKKYYPIGAEKVTVSTLTYSMGFINIFAGIISAMPLCHGSSGITAYYKFGARNKFAMLGSAGFYLIFSILTLIFGIKIFLDSPFFLLGTMVSYTGIEHTFLIKDISHKKDLLVAFSVLGTYLLSNNISLGFIFALLSYSLINKKFSNIF